MLVSQKKHIKKEMLIKKPMLAATLPPGHQPSSFPVLATPKIDGIRALKINGAVVSRTFKPIPNVNLRTMLEEVLPDGADGELVFGSTFQQSSSAIMTRGDEGIGKGRFRFYWFDYVENDSNRRYVDRVEDIRRYVKQNANLLKKYKAHLEIVPLYPTKILNAETLAKCEVSHLNKGFEGTIVRDPDGRYKFGRSTMREGLLLKIKRFNDAEAVVVGVEELMHNGNEATLDRLGHSKRSSHKGNKMASGKLGALVVENVVNGKRVRFKVGTGFKDNERKQLWSDRNSLIGRYAKYKSMEFGTKDAPRHPVFLGFRHKNDM